MSQQVDESQLLGQEDTMRKKRTLAYYENRTWGNVPEAKATAEILERYSIAVRDAEQLMQLQEALAL